MHCASVQRVQVGGGGGGRGVHNCSISGGDNIEPYVRSSLVRCPKGWG